MADSRGCIGRIVILGALAVAAASPGAAQAQGDFNWRRHDGQSINFLSSNHPWAAAVLRRQTEFTQLTGIRLRVDTFQEAQMRQRLVTVMQARRPDVDLYMSLKSREGLQFANAGWYADLRPMVGDPARTNPRYDFADMSQALVRGEEFNTALTGIPLNIEGPVLYVRRDVLERCRVPMPRTLADVPQAAQRIRACDASITPFVTRGAKGAIAYTFSNFLHNLGGDYFASNQSNLCSAQGRAALTMYASLLKDYGPPGVVNYSFLQIRELYGQGRAAMAFESSNEFGPIMAFAGRAQDSTVALLPPGPDATSRPTVIGWGLSLSAYSQNQGPAWYFLQWATSREMQAALALEGIAPPRAAVANSPEYRAWLGEQRVRQEWNAALDAMARTGTSEVGPPMEQQPEARDILGEQIQRMILGQATAEQACAETDRQINALLERERRR